MTRCRLKNALRLQNTEFYYQPSKKKQSLHRIFISTPVASITAQLSSERVAAIEKNKVKYRSKPTYAVYITCDWRYPELFTQHKSTLGAEF